MNPSKSAIVLAMCLVSITTLGADLPPDVAALVAKFKDSDPKVRQQSLTALGKLGEKAKPALPQITEMINDKQTWVMTRALMVIPDIGPDESVIKPVIPFLAKDKDIREYAVNILVCLKEKAVPALVDALKDDTTAEGACNALGIIGKPAKAALPDLAKAQKNKNKPIQDAATDAIRKISK